MGFSTTQQNQVPQHQRRQSPLGGQSHPTTSVPKPSEMRRCFSPTGPPFPHSGAGTLASGTGLQSPRHGSEQAQRVLEDLDGSRGVCAPWAFKHPTNIGGAQQGGQVIDGPRVPTFFPMSSPSEPTRAQSPGPMPSRAQSPGPGGSTVPTWPPSWGFGPVTTVAGGFPGSGASYRAGARSPLRGSTAEGGQSPALQASSVYRSPSPLTSGHQVKGAPTLPGSASPANRATLLGGPGLPLRGGANAMLRSQSPRAQSPVPQHKLPSQTAGLGIGLPLPPSHPPSRPFAYSNFLAGDRSAPTADATRGLGSRAQDLSQLGRGRSPTRLLSPRGTLAAGPLQGAAGGGGSAVVRKVSPCGGVIGATSTNNQAIQGHSQPRKFAWSPEPPSPPKAFRSLSPGPPGSLIAPGTTGGHAAIGVVGANAPAGGRFAGRLSPALANGTDTASPGEGSHRGFR